MTRVPLSHRGTGYIQEREGMSAPSCEISETEEHGFRVGLLYHTPGPILGFSLADRSGLKVDLEFWLAGAEVGGCISPMGCEESRGEDAELRLADVISRGDCSLAGGEAAGGVGNDAVEGGGSPPAGVAA